MIILKASERYATALEGWHLLNRELENIATITRDADGGYIITPIEPEAE